MAHFGEYAKLRIRQLGKSQKALAELLRVSPAYVSQILNGKKNPPDLGRPKYRSDLTKWCWFLDAAEDEVLDLIRYELHSVPPPPSPTFQRMRDLLVQRLKSAQKGLVDEIRAMRLHPAENRAIYAMTQIYLALQVDEGTGAAYGTARFKSLCDRARASKEFVERELVEFFKKQVFSWSWDAEANDVRFVCESSELRKALDSVRRILHEVADHRYLRTVPVVGHVSAGIGFQYTDGGFTVGEGFEQVELPPGVDPATAQTLYCVRVRGDSLQEFFGDGTLLFIKPESWEEIRDGDLVIFKNRKDSKAFVKKVEFSGDNLILRSMNPLYKNIVLSRSDLMLLERVMALVF